MASGREPLDLFGRFTRPTNIHHPAGSGVAFSYLENGRLIGHPAKYAARRCQSSSRYSVQRTPKSADCSLRGWWYNLIGGGLPPAAAEQPLPVRSPE